MAGLISVLDSADLRRVDLAVDTFDGSVTHEKILDAYFAGDFKREGGGRNPKMKKVEGQTLPMEEPFISGLERLLGFFVATKGGGSKL